MKLKKITAVLLTLSMAVTMLAGCGKKSEPTAGGAEETVNLIWYQIGDAQADSPKVLEEVNKYTKEKIGVTIQINAISWADYSKKMQVITNTGENYDLAFTCSWANDYLFNAQKGAFLELDTLLTTHGKDIAANIDPKFLEAAKVGGKVYGIPNEKEIGSMPMWVFTKEYVEKYKIPYQDIHSLEDLEPWLKVVKENEPGVVPFYLTKDYSIPLYFDRIQEPLGIEFGDDTLTVKNLFETDKVKSTLETMRKYYQAGYVNKDAATAMDDKSLKRFVTKGDGQPYAEGIWSKDLGYEVVASPIMDMQITNVSARGSLTAISTTSKHPEKAMELLNLIYSDTYLRNLLNYGIEGVHYEKVAPTADEVKEAEGKPYVLDTKIKMIAENQKNYSVPYWVQGGLFNTYVLESEPLDKWSDFKDYNDSAVASPSFGFDFNTDPVKTQISGFRNVLSEYGASLYTGSVEPSEYLPKLEKKLQATGIDDVKAEMQKQIDEWKVTKK